MAFAFILFSGLLSIAFANYNGNEINDDKYSSITRKDNLSSAKTIDQFNFDFNKLPPQPSAKEIREFIEQQLCPPAPAPPVQPHLELPKPKVVPIASPRYGFSVAHSLPQQLFRMRSVGNQNNAIPAAIPEQAIPQIPVTPIQNPTLISPSQIQQLKELAALRELRAKTASATSNLEFLMKLLKHGEKKDEISNIKKAISVVQHQSPSIESKSEVVPVEITQEKVVPIPTVSTVQPSSHSHHPHLCVQFIDLSPALSYHLLGRPNILGNPFSNPESTPTVTNLQPCKHVEKAPSTSQITASHLPDSSSSPSTVDETQLVQPIDQQPTPTDTVPTFPRLAS